MKKRILSFLIAIVAIIGSTMPAHADFRFGLKAGMNVNSLHFSSETFDASNRAGFTGGAMIEFTVPVIVRHRARKAARGARRFGFAKSRCRCMQSRF